MNGYYDGGLRFAVIGVGAMGAAHADWLDSRVSGAEVSVVSDADQERASAVVSRLVGGARVVADPAEAIMADDVDAVIIASPGPAHAEQVELCLQRGIPVLCEKPLATDPASAYRLVEAEAAVGRRLISVGFMRRFDHEYVSLQRMLAAGELGRPTLLHCVHRNPDQRPDFDSTMMITDSVVHEVDVARFLLSTEITSVQVIKPDPVPDTPAGESDPMLVLLRTAAGQLVTVEIFARSHAGYQVRTEAVGSRGSAIIGQDRTIAVTRPNQAGWVGRIEQVSGGFLSRFASAYVTELQFFVDAVRAGSSAGATAWDGYAAAEVCAAGVQALATEAAVSVTLRPRPTLAWER